MHPGTTQANVKHENRNEQRLYKSEMDKREHQEILILQKQFGVL